MSKEYDEAVKLFKPCENTRNEILAEYLYLRWQLHEAEVAEWSDKTRRLWSDIEPDVQRGFRAMAIAASDYFNLTEYEE